MKEVWRAGDCLALARQGCASCLGLGVLVARGKSSPCKCVFRAVFRSCYDRFRRSMGKEMRYARTAWGESMAMPRMSGGRKKVWAFVEQEYACDFIQIAKRTLGEDSLGWKVFRFHYLLGADQRLCCRKLGLDRGEFFHEVYRVQQRLGRAYRETEPYGLFPTDEYFSHVVCGATRSLPPDGVPFSSSTRGSDGAQRPGRPLRPPIQTAA